MDRDQHINTMLEEICGKQNVYPSDLVKRVTFSVDSLLNEQREKVKESTNLLNNVLEQNYTLENHYEISSDLLTAIENYLNNEPNANKDLLERMNKFADDQRPVDSEIGKALNDYSKVFGAKSPKKDRLKEERTLKSNPNVPADTKEKVAKVIVNHFPTKR